VNIIIGHTMDQHQLPLQPEASEMAEPSAYPAAFCCGVRINRSYRPNHKTSSRLRAQWQLQP
jgi:hypothetical protein